MRVAVTGASGNVGSALLRVLEDEAAVEHVVGLARRPPQWQPSTEGGKVEWVAADVRSDDLAALFTDRGVDAVVHLAWLIQPSRRPDVLEAVNVEGSRRVFEAATRAGVRTLVHASSVGVYSPGPKDRAVDESWPRDGVATSFYARHKAAAERELDRVETENPAMRVVRLRPGLIFQRLAASEIARLFLGPLVPSRLLRPNLIPVVPAVPRLRFQAVHSLDVADAYRLALVNDVRGAFNVAADPVIDTSVLAETLHARPVPVPAALVRAAADWTWRLRLQPTPAGWVDLALGVPVMDTTRAQVHLGWTPRWSSVEALQELLAGFVHGGSGPTPVLAGRHRFGASEAERPGAP